MIFLGTIVGLILGTYAHECGHLIAAKLNAWPIQKLTLGLGPPVLTCKFRKVEIELRPIPLGGRVEVRPMLWVPKFRHLLFCAGGILANLLLLFIFVGLLAVSENPSTSRSLILGVSFAQIWLIFLSLWPETVRRYGTAVDSDGLQIWNLVWRGAAEELANSQQIFDALLKPYQHEPNTTYAASPFSYELLDLFREFPSHGLPQKIQRAEQLYLKEQHLGRITTQEELWLLDTLMTDMLLGSVEIHLPRLEELSNRAISIGENSTAIRQTCSGVLVELNRHRDAQKMLLSAMPEEKEKFAFTICSIFLARIEQAVGNFEAAKELAAKAHLLCQSDFNPKNFEFLLERMDTELSQSGPRIKA